MERKRLCGIDVFKLIGAFFVVAIHTQLSKAATGYLQNLLNHIFDLAVPFYFITSGFLLAKGSGARSGMIDHGNQDVDRSKRMLMRVLKMYLMWSVIYLPLSLIGEFAIYRNSIGKGIFKLVRGWLLVGQNYYSWHLWYLLALVVALLLLWLMLKARISDKGIMVIATVLFVLGIALEIVHDEIPENRLVNAYFSLFMTTRNGIFRGLFYVVLGRITARRKILNWKVSSLILVVCITGCSLIGISYVSELLLPFSAYALFCLSFNFAKDIEGRTGKACRDIGTGIYLVHMYFIAIYRVGIAHGADTYNYILCWVMASALSSIIAFFLVKSKVKGKRLSQILLIE